MDEAERAFKAQYSRARTERLKAAGLCTKCGRNPARPGRMRCEECAKSDAARQKALHEGRKAAGLCTYCGKAPASPGKKMCRPCAEKFNGYARDHIRSVPGCGGDCEHCPLPECTGQLAAREKRQVRIIRIYDEKKAGGVCVRCGRKAAPGHVRCAECLEKGAGGVRKRYAELKARGLCVVCGKRPAAPGKVRCPACVERQAVAQRETRARMKAAGLCMRCGKNPARPGMVTCAPCAEAYAEYIRSRRAGAPKAGYCIDPFGRKRPPKGSCSMCGAKLPEGDFGLCPECDRKREEANKKERRATEG